MYYRVPISKYSFVCLSKKLENALFLQMPTCFLGYFSYFLASIYLTNVLKTMDHDRILIIHNDKHKSKFLSLQEGCFKQFL